MHTRHTLRALAICLGALSLSPSPGAASVAVFECSGIITNVRSARPVFDASVQEGVPFETTFRMDSHAEDGVKSNQDEWGYTDRNPAHMVRASFGNYRLMPDATAEVENRMLGRYSYPGADNMRWGSSNSVGGGLFNTVMLATLNDASGTALTAPGIPPEGPGINDISRWTTASMFVLASRDTPAPRCSWNGRITRIATYIEGEPVPEPGSLALLVAGLPVAVVFFRGRRALRSTI